MAYFDNTLAFRYFFRSCVRCLAVLNPHAATSESPLAGGSELYSLGAEASRGVPGTTLPDCDL